MIEETGLKSPPEDKQNEGDRLNCRRGSVSKNDSRSFSGQLPTVDLAPPLPVKVKIGHVGKDNGTSQENLINSSHRNSPPTNQRSRTNSRMDYVNDWCEGISTSQNEIIDGFVVVKPSTGQLQTELSPELRRSKPQLSNDAKIAPGKPKISNLVRKPSIAKLKALFEGDVNTDSSGPPSSDSCSTDLPVWKRTQNRKDSEPSILTQFASDPDHTTLVPPIRSKHKTKSRTLYINKDEYEHVLKRYEDTSFRIFKEFKLSSAEDLSSSYTELLRCSPSLSTQSEERLRHQDEDSNCSSPYEVRRRSRSTSHSPSSAITDNVSSKSDSVTLQAKELMGRLVGSKRNSFAEKRNSTWYDDTHMLQEMTQHERPSNNTQTKVPLYLSNLEKDKQTNSKKSNTAVKRSISMKVGFRSPLIRRKNIRSDKVAAYLAVEDSGKSRENPSHDRACSQQVEESSMNNTGENITNVNAESYNASKKPAKRLHGHTNVKPVQNPTFFTLSGNPVELTKFIPRDDDTESLECLHDRNKKMYSKTSSHLPDMKSNRQSSGDSLQDIPYGSPVTNRKMKQIKENRPPGNKNLNITKTSLPDIKVDSDRSDIGSTYGSKETFEPESRLTKSAAVDDSSANESRQRIQDGSHEHNGKAATEFNRNHLPINNMTSSLKEGSHIKSDADQFASNSFPSSSLPEIATAKEHPMEHRPHRQDALNGNSYGAEMDEYCQKIIHDCQEYLVNHQYSNLTLEAKNNLFWIENTLQQSPRRAIVDVMSLSQESLKNCKHEHDKHVKGLDSIPNYEKLWFSHTGAIAHSPTKPDTGDTSVEEVTVVFTPNDEEEDETSDDRYPMDKFPNELPEKGAASREYFNVVTYPGPSSDPKVVVPTPASRTPKDAKFSKTVTELKSLIEELEVGMPSKPRKPQPAPRTILASSERAGSPVCYPKNTVTTEMNSNVIQMNSSAFRSADVCDPPSNHDNDKNYFLETDRKVNLNLSQSPLGHMNEHVTTPHLGRDSGKEKLNHEYEEIVFKDDGRDAQPEDHIYEKLCVDSEFPDDLFGQYGNNDRHFQYHIPSDKFQHQTKDIDNHCSASKLYGQVHKPKRKKRHNGMKGSLADDVIAHHPDTFSHKLGKCEHDYESLQMTTSWKRVTESSSRPVAPPRLRRNPSTSDKSFQDLYICRSSTDSSVVTKLNQGVKFDYLWDRNSCGVSRNLFEK